MLDKQVLRRQFAYASWLVYTLNAPYGCAAITGIVRAIRTGVFMCTCAFVTSIVYLTILTVIEVICIEFKREQLVLQAYMPCLTCVCFCWPQPIAQLPKCHRL